MGEETKKERGNQAERELIEHIWMEVTEVRDMLVMSRRGIEDEKDVDAVQSVMRIAEKLLEGIIEKLDRFLT